MKNSLESLQLREADDSRVLTSSQEDDPFLLPPAGQAAVTPRARGRGRCPAALFVLAGGAKHRDRTPDQTRSPSAAHLLAASIPVASIPVASLRDGGPVPQGCSTARCCSPPPPPPGWEGSLRIAAGRPKPPPVREVRLRCSWDKQTQMFVRRRGGRHSHTFTFRRPGGNGVSPAGGRLNIWTCGPAEVPPGLSAALGSP